MFENSLATARAILVVAAAIAAFVAAVMGQWVAAGVLGFGVLWHLGLFLLQRRTAAQVEQDRRDRLAPFSEA